jgi:hypothetical protein
LNIFQKVCRNRKEHRTSPPETFATSAFSLPLS